jgi:hypothetical protein
MSTTERQYAGDWIEWLASVDYNIEAVTVKQDAEATEGLVSGEVMENSGGKKIVCATGGNADSILLEPVALADLQGGDVKRAALVRGPAVINSSQINVASAQKTAALAALLVKLIVAKANPTVTTQTT